MKTKKKRLAALTIGLVLSIIMITPFSIVHAYSHRTIEYLDEGQASWAIIELSGAVSDWSYCIDVDINYNDYTSTLVYINVPTSVNSAIMCDDCYVYDSTTSLITVKLTCTKQARVLIYVPTPYNVIDIWDGAGNGIITHYHDGQFNYIYNSMVGIQSIDGKFTTLNAKVSDIYSAIDGLESSLSNIENYVDDIATYLSGIQSTLNSINNKINTLPYQSYTPRSYSASTDDVNYSNNDITNNIKDIYVKFSPALNDNNYIYRIDTGVSSNNYNASINVVDVVNISNSQYDENFNPKYYLDHSGRTIIIYLYDTYLNGNNDTREIKMQFYGGDYYLRYRDNMFNITVLDDQNPYYWSMMQSFKYLDALTSGEQQIIIDWAELIANQNYNTNRLLDRIKGVNVTQAEQDTLINNFNDIGDDITSIETNFVNTFNTNLESFKQGINEAMPTRSDFVNAGRFLNDTFLQVFNLDNRVYMLVNMVFILAFVIIMVG